MLPPEPVWKPSWKYDRPDQKSGHKIPSAMVLEDQALFECPVSLISKDPHAAEFVRLYNQARRQGTTLSKLLRDNSAYIEDVEEALFDAKALIKIGWEKEHERYRS